MERKMKKKYVTEEMFLSVTEETRDSIRSLDGKFRSLDGRVLTLDKKIDNITLALLNTNQRADRMEQDMATKKDINLILDRIDHFVKKVDVHSKKSLVHDYRINELEGKMGQHDQRITALEAK